ncbi:MAG: IPT/TIG domain-containing protein [Muribaculaceae bacterium]|nr:IPT/TIG domain-containing protein [Muribaculaceae bacterium]
MKQIFKYTLLAAGCVVAGLATACSEESYAEQDKGATPVVKYVRPCDVNLSDSLLTSASLGQQIAFIGENLGDVQQIWFNDKKALLSPNLVTSHTIVVSVPNSLPGEVTGKARLITSTGIEVDYPFDITVPAPRVQKIDCEYAHAGEVVTIEGAYFADDPNVPLTVTIGGVDAEVRSIQQDVLEVVVPEGATEGPVVVTTIYGEGESGFHYMDTRGMLFDFERDGLTGLGLDAQNWHARPVREDEISISGNYMIIGNGEKVLNAAADWDDSNYSFEYWSGAWTDPVEYPARVGERLFDVADFTDFNNKSLKFELYIPTSNPWHAGAMQLIFSPTSMVSLGNPGTDVFGNDVAGCNNTYLQEGGLARYLWTPWTSSTAYDTAGKWITVSFPIKDFVYDKDGTGASRMLSDVTDFANLQIFVWAGGVTGEDCTPLFYIDNIRVVAN